jgi:hypothetical protein
MYMSVVPHNAAPEWQAKSLALRSKELLVACPLEGLVRLSLNHQQHDSAHISLKQHPYELANRLQKT